MPLLVKASTFDYLGMRLRSWSEDGYLSCFSGPLRTDLAILVSRQKRPGFGRRASRSHEIKRDSQAAKSQLESTTNVQPEPKMAEAEAWFDESATSSCTRYSIEVCFEHGTCRTCRISSRAALRISVSLVRPSLNTNLSPHRYGYDQVLLD